MTTLQHYREIIIDYHHDQQINRVELNTKDDAEKLYGMLKVNNHIKHYPNLKTEQVQITEDSLWYPSMRPVNDSSWVWITDAHIVEKPE